MKIFTILIILSSNLYAAEKPKVWIYTDMSDKSLRGSERGGSVNDPDDISTMAGYLLMCNMFETQGIVVASTHREEHKYSVDQAVWANEYFGNAYSQDVVNLNSEIGGYPTEISFMESCIKLSAERYNPNRQYNSLEGYSTVNALFEKASNSDGVINVLCWGSLTEPAILVNYCLSTANIDVLKNIRFIAHWTNSNFHQGSLTQPENVANCREDALACEYMKRVALEGIIEYYECGAIGQHGIVSGSPKGMDYFSGFKASRLGEIFIEGKYVYNCVDHSDSATYWSLLGGYGVSLKNIASDGTNPPETERKNEVAFSKASKLIHDELLRRSRAAQDRLEIFESLELEPSPFYGVEIKTEKGQWSKSYVNFDKQRELGAGAKDLTGQSFSWTTFRASNRVSVMVKRLDGDIKAVKIRPLRYGIEAKLIDSETAEFTINPGQKVSIEFDIESDEYYSMVHGVKCIKQIMMVFADEIKPYRDLAGVDESDILRLSAGKYQKDVLVKGLENIYAGQCTIGDAGRKRVVIFEKGIYDIGYWQVPNNIEQIHICGGALVFGALDILPQGIEPCVEELKNIRSIYENWHTQKLREKFKLSGHGILSGAKLPWHLQKDFSYQYEDDYAVMVKAVQLAVRDIDLTDITVANSPYWVISFINDTDARTIGRIDNVKLVGAWTYNNDGMPNLSGSSSVISNSFIHAKDDSFKIYNSDSIIENCVVWQANNGAVFQFGWFPKNVSNVIIKDIDIIYYQAWYGGNSNQAIFNYAKADGKGLINNIIFKNINIEGDILRLFGFDCGDQKIRNVVFDNLTCGAMDVGNKCSLGNNYFKGDISDFVFKRFIMNGNLVESNKDALFEFYGTADPNSFIYKP